MNAGLPQSAHDPHRFYSEFVAQVQKYRGALLAENIKETIHAVAANTAVSQQVITKIQSELRAAHRMFFKFGTISATVILEGYQKLSSASFRGSPFNC